MKNKADMDREKFFNTKEIKKNLIDVSLYFSFFEILNNTIVERIADFYNNEFRDGKSITSDKYKEEIINREFNGKSNIFLASCHWLIENNVISQDEFEIITQIKEHRNRIAHDLTKFLFDSEYEINKDLFNQIKTLTIKIVRWWITEVEIPTNPDFDGQEINADEIIPGQEILLDYIFNVANTDTDEVEHGNNNTKSQKNNT